LFDYKVIKIRLGEGRRLGPGDVRKQDQSTILTRTRAVVRRVKIWRGRFVPSSNGTVGSRGLEKQYDEDIKLIIDGYRLDGMLKEL